MGAVEENYSLNKYIKIMKLAIMASIFIISSTTTYAFTISENEAKSAIVADRARRATFGSNNDRECIQKQCQWEEYLEGRENLDKTLGVNVRKELEDSQSRSGSQWHKDLFEKWYTNCWKLVTDACLNESPFNFQHDCYTKYFAVKRDEYYAEKAANDY